MTKRVPIILILVLCVLALAGCATERSLDGAILTVDLTIPTKGVDDTGELRVRATLNQNGEGVPGQKVTAEVFDPNDVSVGTFKCSGVSDTPGVYQSKPIELDKGAVAGVWRVQVIVGQGENTLMASNTAYLGADAVHAFYLQVPIRWDEQEQVSAKNRGIVRYDCFPASEDRELSGNAGYLEIRYENGLDIKTDEALEAVLAEYEPAGAPKRDYYVDGYTTDQLSGYEARVLRGGIVTEYTPAYIPTVTPTTRPYAAALHTKQAKSARNAPTVTPIPTRPRDRNFGVHVARFYCGASDRTYTIIAAATTDDLLSEIWSVLDDLDTVTEI